MVTKQIIENAGTCWNKLREELAMTDNDYCNISSRLYNVTIWEWLYSRPDKNWIILRKIGHGPTDRTDKLKPGLKWKSMQKDNIFKQWHFTFYLSYMYLLFISFIYLNFIN